MKKLIELFHKTTKPTKPVKPMATINIDYIEALKKTVAAQEEIFKQTERALVKARAFNPKLDMVVAHYEMSSDFRRKNNIEEIDDWEPNV